MHCNISKDIIYDLSYQFRNAMSSAHKNGEFKNVIELQQFPRGSCGVASCLLGEYLMEHSITTKYEDYWYAFQEKLDKILAEHKMSYRKLSVEIGKSPGYIRYC